MERTTDCPVILQEYRRQPAAAKPSSEKALQDFDYVTTENWGVVIARHFASILSSYHQLILLCAVAITTSHRNGFAPVHAVDVGKTTRSPDFSEDTETA